MINSIYSLCVLCVSVVYLKMFSHKSHRVALEEIYNLNPVFTSSFIPHTSSFRTLISSLDSSSVENLPVVQ